MLVIGTAMLGMFWSLSLAPDSALNRPSGGVRTSLGMLALRGIPWALLVFGLVLTLSGQTWNGYVNTWNGYSVMRRLSTAVAIVLLSLLVTWAAAYIWNRF